MAKYAFSNQKFLMKRLLIACIALSATLLCHAADAPPATMAVHSLAREFAAFWDETQQMPEAERVAAFKSRIGARFPEFYDIARYKGERSQAEHDEVIRGNIAAFGKRRQAYLDKVAKFDADLPRHVATFSKAFPDFKPEVTTYFLHSLGEMDGGMRDFDGRLYLIFGADMMTRLHGNGDEAAFFHHELFHAYHGSLFNCGEELVWQRLWAEGLATHVSKVLNPQANEQEMLLDFPAGSANLVQGQIYVSLTHLEQVLDSTDSQQQANLFNMNGRSEDGLQPRRGYFLGYQIAQELGKTRSLSEMAKLSCTAVRPLIGSAITTLKARAQRP